MQQGGIKYIIRKRHMNEMDELLEPARQSHRGAPPLCKMLERSFFARGKIGTVRQMSRGANIAARKK